MSSTVVYQIFIPHDKNGKSDLVWQKKLEEAKNLVEKEIEKLVN